MAVKIRLARRGRKRYPFYSIVVADARAPRDGRFIEKLGTFNPNVNPEQIVLDTDRALYWVMTGAQPTETARDILSNSGVMLRKHLQVGVQKGAITQEDADAKYNAWLGEKTKSVEAKQGSITAALEADAKKKFEAETARKKSMEDAQAAVVAAAAAEVKAAEDAKAAAKAAEVAAAEAEAKAAEDAKAAAEAPVVEETPAAPEATKEAPAAEGEAPATEEPKEGSAE